MLHKKTLRSVFKKNFEPIYQPFSEIHFALLLFLTTTVNFVKLVKSFGPLFAHTYRVFFFVTGAPLKVLSTKRLI